MDFTEITKILLGKIKIKQLVILCFIVSTGILMSPDYILTKIRLNGFVDEWGNFIGIVFILSVGCIVTSCIISTYDYFKNLYKKKKYDKKIKENIDGLNDPEKGVLCEFIDQNIKTVNNVAELDFYDPLVKSLANKGLIIRLTDRVPTTFDYISRKQEGYVSYKLHPSLKEELDDVVEVMLKGQNDKE